MSHRARRSPAPALRIQFAERKDCMNYYVDYRELRYRRQKEQETNPEQPLKWFVGFVVFVLALAITFAEVEGAILNL